MNEELIVVPTTIDLNNSLSHVWDNTNNILSLDNLSKEAELISNNCLALATQSNNALKNAFAPFCGGKVFALSDCLSMDE